MVAPTKHGKTKEAKRKAVAAEPTEKKTEVPRAEAPSSEPGGTAHYVADSARFAGLMASVAFAQSFSGGKPHPVGIVAGVVLAYFFACYLFKELAGKLIPGWSAIVGAVLATCLLGAYGWWLFQPPVVKIVFKPSPAGAATIGPWRRYRIELAITEFRNYLSEVGFRVPEAVPPIGIGRGSLVLGYESISISPDDISDDREVVAQYSGSVFAELFPTAGGTTATGDRITLTRLYSSYFTYSHFESLGTDHHPIVLALWEMGSDKRLGPDFVSYSMLGAFKQLEADKGQPCPPPNTLFCGSEDFDKHFAGAFIGSAMNMFDFGGDSFTSNLTLVNDIFRKHGIDVTKD
jgi:hypothetical protein